MPEARAIALYLPQFHPIPENDLWWGKGFTEWTNTAKARPRFRGHYQPHIPADLGFYDLRVPETRVLQAKMAKQFGIEGFCYYHYWFAGRRILNRPFDEVLASQSPDYPFCLCWANETWSGIWHGAPNTVLIEQTYPGDADHQAHFEHLLPAFQDRRYIRVCGNPLFMIYKPFKLPEPERVLKLWRTMARQAGLGGLHLVANSTNIKEDPVSIGFDAVVRGPDFKLRDWARGWRDPISRVRQSISARLGRPQVYHFKTVAAQSRPSQEMITSYPCIVHAWDNTPRSGHRGVVYANSDPEIYRDLLKAGIEAVSAYPLDQKLIFLKSWNEWAEGNHLEPDLRYGTAYLQVISDVFKTGR